MIIARGRIKAKILDGVTIQQTLVRIAHQILERNLPMDELALVGIRERGEILAKRLAGIFKSAEGIIIPVSVLAHDRREQPLAEHKTIILVDDVICTGREAHRAIATLLNERIAECIQLAVLIDRGNRQIPVHADYVGKSVPTCSDEYVEVRLKELDKEEQVLIMENRQCS